MLARSVKGALFLGAFALVSYTGTAFAEPPPVAAPSTPVAAPAPVAAAPAPAATLPTATAPHGAVVVAVTDDAGPAARALAHEVYREPMLRPSIDEATARVLTGDGAATATGAATAPGSAGKLAEIAALRGSIAASVTDITTRHLLASLGASLHADLVVAVSMTGGNATARVLHTGTASYEDAMFGAGILVAADGARTFTWPGVATTLRGLLPAPPAPPPVSEPPKPVVKALEPVTDEHKRALSDQRPMWKSPWFWAAIGGVAVVGVTVFVLSKTASTTTLVHLDGSVAP